jgi:hypothetical protein
VNGMDFVSARRIVLIIFAGNSYIYPYQFFVSFMCGSEYINRKQFRFLFNFI